MKVILTCLMTFFFFINTDAQENEDNKLSFKDMLKICEKVIERADKILSGPSSYGKEESSPGKETSQNPDKSPKKKKAVSINQNNVANFFRLLGSIDFDFRKLDVFYSYMPQVYEAFEKLNNKERVFIIEKLLNRGKKEYQLVAALLGKEKLKIPFNFEYKRPFYNIKSFNQAFTQWHQTKGEDYINQE